MIGSPVARGTGSPAQRSARGWWLATLLILAPALVPPSTLVILTVSGGIDVGIPLSRLAQLFLNTLLLTAAVTVTALAIGTFTAWATTRTNIPGRKAWMLLAALPLVVPSYVAALAIIGATGNGGLISETVGWDLPTPYGFSGAWIALSVFLAPMVHLSLVPALKRIDPATEEAAIGLGASRLKAFLTVVMPQMRPALVSGGLLVGLYTVSDFGAVSLLRFDTFTRAIYALYVGQLDRAPAVTLSLVLMALAVTILLLQRRVTSRAVYHSDKAPHPIHARLRPSTRRWITGLLGVYLLAALVIPTTVMAYWLLRGVDAGQVLGNFWDEVGRSVAVSLGAAVLAAVAAFPVAMVTTRFTSRWSGPAETLVWATYALPHIAVGVAVVTFALETARPLYQSLTLLLITYVVMFLAQAMSSTQDSLRRASPDLELASYGLGQGTMRTLARVTLPLARSGMVAGAALVFLSVMKELPATLLLRPNGFETLAVRIWSTTGEGFYTQAAAAGLLLLAASVIPLLAVIRRDLSD